MLSLIRKKINNKINFQITNDFIHFSFLKLILNIFLRNRYKINSCLNGAKIMCITFDCDTPEDMKKLPGLLELLNAEETQNSFAIVGQLVNKYPTIVNKIIEEGHEIINHTFSHPENFHFLNKKEMKIEINKFQEIMIKSFNYRVKGFRVPHLMRNYNENLFYILKKENLYDSSYIGHGVTTINDVVEIALTASPEHPQLSFDLYNYFQFPFFRSSIDNFLRLWNILLSEEHIINIYFDPYIIQNDLLKKMIRMGKSQGFSFYRLIDIVEKFQTNK